MDTAPSLTPGSTVNGSIGPFGLGPNPAARPGSSFPSTPLSFVDSTGAHVPLTDVSAMMFPSTDPFAYPNQPMTTFENNHNLPGYEPKGASPVIHGLPFHVSGIDVKPQPAGFSPAVGPQQRPRGDDVHLFGQGPMPMYLMQGAQLAGAQGQGQRFVQAHQPPPPMARGGANVNLDDLFGGEEWANTFMDPSLGLSGGSSYGANPGFPPGANGVAGWR
jgi:hypothetical protein